MSVDKFGRHESTLTVRRETQRSLRKDIGFQINDDGDFDFENRKIRNLGEPIASSDGVHLQYIRDNCLLLPDSGGVNVKGYNLSNVAEPVSDTDTVNLQFLNNNTISLQGDVFSANGRRVANVKEGMVDDDAVNMNQFFDHKKYITSELYKLSQVFRTRVDNLLSYIYEIHTDLRTIAGRLHVTEETLTKQRDKNTQELFSRREDRLTQKLLADLDKGLMSYDWRHSYVGKT